MVHQSRCVMSYGNKSIIKKWTSSNFQSPRTPLKFIDLLEIFFYKILPRTFYSHSRPFGSFFSLSLSLSSNFPEPYKPYTIFHTISTLITLTPNYRLLLQPLPLSDPSQTLQDYLSNLLRQIRALSVTPISNSHWSR